MTLKEDQKAIIDEIINLAKDYEYSKSNQIIEFAIKEWQEDLRNNKETYDKIYKKVMKNEHYLAQRYANLDDMKRIQVVAALYIEEIANEELFEQLDDNLKSAVFNIAKIEA